MSEARSHPLPEDHGYLWLLAAPPAIWAAHFLASYVTAAVWCARFAGRDGVVGGVSTAILWFTAVALGAIGFVGWGAYQRHTHEGKETPHHEDTPEDRHRFLGYATLLLSGLSAVATIFSALAASFFETCQ
jgi:hypothetical protein